MTMFIESGVDAPFEHGGSTPFVSEISKVVAEVEREAFPKGDSNRSLLKGPPRENLGPERGRLNRLYAVYASDKSAENLNRLLVEVELYARRVTLGKGGKYARYLNYSATTAHPQTVLSMAAVTKVWRKLDGFDGRSKFSTWVFRIATNVVKDAERQIHNRHEIDFLDWKTYGEDESVSRSGPGGHAPDVFDGDDGGGHGWQPLPNFKAYTEPTLPISSLTTREQPDGLVSQLDELVQGLSVQDRQIVGLFRRGFKPADIGLEFNQNAKWASNNLARIKEILRTQAMRGETQETRDEELIDLIELGYTTTMISGVLTRDRKWVRDQIKRLGLANTEAKNVLAVNERLDLKAKADSENVLVLKEQALPASEAALICHPGGAYAAPPSF
jgi:RNA polymerase sigma factor (sigma-70 family)